MPPIEAPTNTARGTAIIYLHGNFECVQDSFALLQPLLAADVAVLQVEFPGFCGADGQPTFNAIANQTLPGGATVVVPLVVTSPSGSAIGFSYTETYIPAFAYGLTIGV